MLLVGFGETYLQEEINLDSVTVTQAKVQKSYVLGNTITVPTCCVLLKLFCLNANTKELLSGPILFCFCELLHSKHFLFCFSVSLEQLKRANN